MNGDSMNDPPHHDLNTVIKPHLPAPVSPFVRLLVIPFAVAAAWLLETFLLEGNVHLFQRFEPAGIILYTLIACILLGMIVPFICITRSFVSGAVNIYQIGFRSLRRTLPACAVTGITGYAVVILFNPFGTDRIAFVNAFLLLLPTASASVMTCWVLVGTHVQALVRSGGALFSIPAGVVITSVVFGITPLAHSFPVVHQDTTFWFICIGIITSLFFFSVRDVYATTIAVAGSSIFVLGPVMDTVNLQNSAPAVYFSAVLAVAVLAGIHWYISRNYATIEIPER
jgi:hypothetical protein